MDECKVCGRKNPVEGANFCYYCGASLRESDRDERDDPEDRRVIDAEQGRKTGFGKIAAWINAAEDEPDDEDEYPEWARRRSLREDPEAGRAESAGSTGYSGEPAISRWKILGLMILLLIPVYGWLFLLGWAIVNVVSSRASDGQKEIAHGILMFIAAAIVLYLLASAYMNAHPEVMAEYKEMLQQQMTNSG